MGRLDKLYEQCIKGKGNINKVKSFIDVFTDYTQTEKNTIYRSVYKSGNKKLMNYIMEKIPMDPEVVIEILVDELKKEIEDFLTKEVVDESQVEADKEKLKQLFEITGKHDKKEGDRVSGKDVLRIVNDNFDRKLTHDEITELFLPLGVCCIKNGTKTYTGLKVR